jgi:hypothetical protein
MQRSSGPRKTASNFSESIYQQLNVCAIAAAVAVMLLAGSWPGRILQRRPTS